MDHNLVNGGKGVQCTVCQWTWKQDPGRGGCPGVVRYKSGEAPANLFTEGQLLKKHLKPGTERRGVVRNQYGTYDLFDLAEAVPFSEEEIAAERAKNRAYRYRTCKKCGKEVRKDKWSSTFEVCNECLPEVLEQRRIRREQERMEEEQRFGRFLARKRDEAILEARKWLCLEQCGVILDTETTGLDCAEAIEIAVIGLDGSVLINQRVKPKGEISDGAYAVHKISKEMLEACPTWDQVYPKVVEVLTGKRVIVYNAAFDSGIIDYSSYLYHLPALSCDWDCAMEAYARYYGEWNDYHHSFRWQKLQGGDHSAVGDCRATLELIKRMAETKLSTEA